MLTPALQPLPLVELALPCLVHNQDEFMIYMKKKNPCLVPLVFGSAESSVTSFPARCWQGVCVHTALGWPGDTRVCHGVASLCIPLYYVLSGLRQTSLRSVTHKSTITRLRVSQLVFSRELEILCRRGRIKIAETRLLPYERSQRRKFLGRWRRRGQAACEHGNVIFNLDKGVTAGLS